MRQIYKLILLAVLSSGFSTKRKVEILDQTDSLAVSKTVTAFFNWYIDAIKNKRHIEFQPRFIENDKGMTTLDYSVYIGNLKNIIFQIL